MKKLIAISVMCALVVGAAFADTTFGGQIFVKGELMNGTNETDSFPGTGAIGLDAYNTLVKMTFGDTTAGGWLGIHNGNGAWYHGFAWWRPIPQLKLQLGRNQDGDFGSAQISGWGFTGEAKNLTALGEYKATFLESQGRDHSRTTGWYPGISGWALEASLYPAEGLSVNLAIPIGDTQAAGLTFSKFEANVQYRLTDIGNVTLSFQSNTGWVERDKVLDGNRKTDPQTPQIDGKPDPDFVYKADPASWHGATDLTGTPKIWASFYLTAIENIGVDLGVAYKFPLQYSYGIRSREAGDLKFPEYTHEYNQNFPIEVGLGFRYGQGDFGFKLRAAVSLAGSTESTTAPKYVNLPDPEDPDKLIPTLEPAKKETVNDPLQLSVSILPTYKIGANTFYLYAGLGIQSVEDWEAAGVAAFFKETGSNSVLSWFVNPYVLIPAGSMRFLVGFQLWSDGVGYPYYQSASGDPTKQDGVQKFDPAKINWAIPIGFYTYF
jgi:hypothetical protein